MPHRRRAGGRGAPPSPLPVVDPSDGIPAHGIIELLSMVLPEGENDEVEFDDGSTSGGNSSDDDGGHRRSPTTTHTVDGRRQRAFETVLASGFTAVRFKPSLQSHPILTLVEFSCPRKNVLEQRSSGCDAAQLWQGGVGAGC